MPAAESGWSDSGRAFLGTADGSSAGEKTRCDAALEAGQRAVVGSAGEVFLESAGEYGVFLHPGGGLGKEGDGGVELEVIRVAEDLIERPPFDTVDQSDTLTEAWTKNRVAEIGAGLGETRDGESLGHGARSEALHLRKDKPHPVRSLLSGCELGSRLGVGGGLRVEEALEMKGIVQEGTGGVKLSSCGVGCVA